MNGVPPDRLDVGRHSCQMRALLSAFFGLVVPLLLASSCSSGNKICSTQSVHGLMVTVNANGTALCDAAVVAKDGDYGETLRGDPSGNCKYTGADERPGTYVVTASFRDAAAPAQTVTVSDESTGCHVVPQNLTFDLGDVDASSDAGT